MRAIGLVHLDLQAAQENAGKAAADAAGAKVLHVTTSNLVYLNKLGVAATNEYIDFQSGAMTGHATGADYNSDTGVLTMHSAVSMSGVAGKRPVQVTAATAEVDNRNQEMFLDGCAVRLAGTDGRGGSGHAAYAARWDAGAGGGPRKCNAMQANGRDVGLAACGRGAECREPAAIGCADRRRAVLGRRAVAPAKGQAEEATDCLRRCRRTAAEAGGVYGR